MNEAEQLAPDNLEESKQFRTELRRAREVYESVFSGFEKKVLDFNRFNNILRILRLIRTTNDKDTAEVFFVIREARKIYSEEFSRRYRLLDGDPIGNIIRIGELLYTRHLPTESLLQLIEETVKQNRNILDKLRRRLNDDWKRRQAAATDSPAVNEEEVMKIISDDSGRASD